MGMNKQVHNKVIDHRLFDGSTQALKLYYKMHDKVERPISGLDAHDLEEQASIADTDAMVDRAAAFFTSSKLVTRV